MRYTYSWWDGRQAEAGLDPDTVLAALTEEVLSAGDLGAALRHAVQWGLQTPEGDFAIPGLQHLRQAVQGRRSELLGRYDPDGPVRDLEEQLERIAAAERAGIEQRRAALPADETALAAMLDRRRETLDALPAGNPAAMLAALDAQELIDPAAREALAALSEALARLAVERRLLRGSELLNDPQRAAELTAALRDFNDALEDRRSGAQTDPNDERHRGLFPDAPTIEEALAGLREHMDLAESAAASMSATGRAQLDGALERVLAGSELGEQLGRLATALQADMPGPARGYDFHGSAPLSFAEAVDVVRELRRLDELEGQVMAALSAADPDLVDSECVTRTIGMSAAAGLDALRAVPHALTAAGYMAAQDGEPVLTGRGVRQIGEQAIADIFTRLPVSLPGDHRSPEAGAGSDALDESRPYAFGDPFLLDLNRTVFNAVRRGSTVPIKLADEDFQVFRPERRERAATVLLLDTSRSMPLRGCFVAAKRLAIAFDSLIRSRYPHDHLYVLTFSDLARLVPAGDLYRLRQGEDTRGTNMQHALLSARRLLGRHRGEARQIVLVTDGEPTAYCEHGQVRFTYPPTDEVVRATLREADRCTREGIIINTFMVERSAHLADFVRRLTRINHGRALFATPDRLGAYVLLDYIAGRDRAAVRLRR